MRDTFLPNARYQAGIKLGFLKSMASNDQVAQYFTDLGFFDVAVTGSGRSRTVTGTWRGPMQTIDRPDEIEWVRTL